MWRTPCQEREGVGCLRRMFCCADEEAICLEAAGDRMPRVRGSTSNGQDEPVVSEVPAAHSLASLPKMRRPTRPPCRGLLGLLAGYGAKRRREQELEGRSLSRHLGIRSCVYAWTSEREGQEESRSRALHCHGGKTRPIPSSRRDYSPSKRHQGRQQRRESRTMGWRAPRRPARRGSCSVGPGTFGALRSSSSQVTQPA